MYSNIRPCEALKPVLGTEAATMLAEALPEHSRLATKDDLVVFKDHFQSLKDDFSSLRNECAVGFKTARADQEKLRADMMTRLVTFFVPLWIGVYGTLIAVIVAIFAKG